MCHTNRMILSLVTAIVAMTMLAAQAYAQDNPYRVDEGWAKLEQGRKWGAAVGVDIDRDGKSIWVFDRCASATDCSDSPLNPIQKFDASGKLVRASAPACSTTRTRSTSTATTISGSPTAAPRTTDGKGHTVMKFGPRRQGADDARQGGCRGNGPDTFNGPSDVLVAPDGGIFVADGQAARPTRAS